MNGTSIRNPATASIATDSRLRILLFTNSVAIGGMEEHVELLARHLDRRRFEVFAITPRWLPTASFSKAIAELADHSAEITPDLRYGLLSMVRETWRLAQQIRRWRIQIVHMHSTTYRGQYYALLAAKLAGVRAVYVTEHLAPESNLPIIESIARTIFSHVVDGIVCVSQKNCEARSARVYTPRNRTLIVNNGVDLDDFPPIEQATLTKLREQYAIPANARIVGTAVRFEAEKGVPYFIDAMPAIRTACPDTYFLMVGDGKLRAELEAQVARLGMTDYVRFTGFQSDPRPFLGLMNVFVLPVPVGSMSIGLLEAMAMERAVVMSFGGEGEAVVHGESGFCAEPRSATSIAHYVINILETPLLQTMLGTAARHRIDTTFSAQQVARTLSTLYEHGLHQEQLS